MKTKVSLGLARMSIPLKIEKARAIVSLMTGNANFTTPFPALAAVADAATALENAFGIAQNGGPAQTSAMYDREETLDKLLIQLSGYVEFTANGDETIILGAGIGLKGKASGKPYTFAAANGKHEGEVKLTTAVTPRASYVWEISDNPFPVNPVAGISPWKQLKITTVAKVTLGNLTPLQKYWFRVAPIVKDVQKAWSDPVSIVAK